MPNYTCPSCRQTFHLTDDPEGKCIFCGASLRDFRPPGLFHNDGCDLSEIAFGQRWLIRVVPFAMIGQALFIFGPSLYLGRVSMGWVEIAPTFVVMYALGKMLSGMGEASDKALVLCLLMLLPILNAITLIILNARAMEIFEKANLKVGILGVSATAAEAAMDSSLCSECGYNLKGNTSGRCPECGTHIPR